MESSYGDQAADIYDEVLGESLDSGEPFAAFLQTEFEPKTVLEIGVGTGRLAVALARHDIAVTGLDASARMLDLLRSYAADADVHIEAVAADACHFDLDRQFDMVTCVFNTLYTLGDHNEQRSAVASFSRHLCPGGRLVIEGWSPAQQMLVEGPPTRSSVVREVTDLHALVSFTEVDPTKRVLRSQDVVFSAGGIRVVPVQSHYWSLDGFDALCRVADLEPESRWLDAGKQKTDLDQRFDGEATNRVISVYRRR